MSFNFLMNVLQPPVPSPLRIPLTNLGSQSSHPDPVNTTSSNPAPPILDPTSSFDPRTLQKTSCIGNELRTPRPCSLSPSGRRTPRTPNMLIVSTTRPGPARIYPRVGLWLCTLSNTYRLIVDTTHPQPLTRHISLCSANVHVNAYTSTTNALTVDATRPEIASTIFNFRHLRYLSRYYPIGLKLGFWGDHK
jgi:hypothetical protein